MPVMACAGTAGCARMISVSTIRGGNPSAKADPEGFAGEWSQCSSCRAFTCDRCLAAQGGRCACGQEGKLFTEDERIALAMRMMGLGPGPAGPTPPGAIAMTRLTPPSRGAPGGALGSPSHEDRSARAAGGALVGAFVGGVLGLWLLSPLGALLGAAICGGLAYVALR